MKLDRVIAVRNNKTVFRDGKRCVKVFSPDYSKARVLTEALNHARAEECVDFVPKLLEVVRYEKNWAIVYEFVKGKTFLQWMEEDNAPLSSKVSSFAAVQEKLHSTSGGALAKMKDCFFDAIDKVSLDQELKSTLRRGLEKMEFSSALCHADFVPSNLVIGEDGSYTVIDWAMAMSGEPLADSAITYLLMKIRGRDEFAEEYRRRYPPRLNKNDEAFREWIPYAAVFLMNLTNEAERSALLPYVKSIQNKGETK